mmetsp:Transcript_23641/g.53205  ORF Transcript_23641/g.53205 Transcript_23641/m.53205 type:complete len:150 (+) Transcript_23641:55-504(+)
MCSLRSTKVTSPGLTSIQLEELYGREVTSTDLRILAEASFDPLAEGRGVLPLSHGKVSPTVSSKLRMESSKALRKSTGSFHGKPVAHEQAGALGQLELDSLGVLRQLPLSDTAACYLSGIQSVLPGLSPMAQDNQILPLPSGCVADPAR